MKYILPLIILIIACTSDRPVSHDNAKVLSQIESHYKKSLADFYRSTEQLKTVIKTEYRDSVKVRSAFYNARLKYKAIETIAEFYNPDYCKRLNGPPVDKVDTGAPERIIEATGLQVLEEYLFPSYNKEVEKLAFTEAERIFYTAEVLSRESEALVLNHQNVIEAIKVEFLRSVSLGISGFDSPLAFYSLEEAQAIYDNIRQLIFIYEPLISEELKAKLRVSFDNIHEYLSSGDFNSFDRLHFIKHHLQPLYRLVFDCQNELDIPNNHISSAINFSEPVLFGAQYYNLNYFEGLMPKNIDHKELTHLGGMLFYDQSLSKENDRSCATCHVPALAFTDGLAKSIGLDNKEIIRNAPTLLNSGLQQELFYDSRAKSLETQIENVVNNKNELHGSMTEIVKMLKDNGHYDSMWIKAFNDGEIDAKKVELALAAYVRSLTSLNSRFDLYLRGEGQLDRQEILGFNLYMGKAKCGTCHFAPLFNGTIPPFYTENESEVIGVSKTSAMKTLDLDSGRYHIYGGALNLYAFRIPTVRNVELTAPYMHNGAFTTLTQVIDFYNKGGGNGLGFNMAHQTLPEDNLNLSKEEQESIIAFLKTLTDNPFDKHNYSL